MPKGKKYTAAEKHFLKQKEDLDKEIKSLKNENRNLKNSLAALQKAKSDLETENIQYKEWTDRLLEYAKLSESDIKRACEKDKNIAEFRKLFKVLTSWDYLYKDIK